MAINSLCLVGLLTLLSCSRSPSPDYREWKAYGGSKQRIQYSSLAQIDTSNVKKLEIAWVYHTKDAGATTSMKVNPLIIDGVLYALSPKLKLIALEASTGKLRWTYDPFAKQTDDTTIKVLSYSTCRGLAYYEGSTDDKRLFYTVNSSLVCVDAIDGKPVLSFGKEGRIDLHDDLGRDVSKLKVVFTSPGMVYRDLIIIGSSLTEEAESAPGHIRAYDVHTGKLRWIFHTIPYPGEFGFDSWKDSLAYKYNGGANAWGGFSLDEQRGIVFVPTGSATYDFYGGKRIGDNLFANSVIALEAGTGKRIWYFQTIHHDLWDWDLPTSPVLVTIEKEGKKIDAVVQVSKTGHIFLFERTTGKPVYPVIEKAVLTNTTLSGEQVSPTQPYPSFFEPFARQGVTEEDLNKHLPPASYEEVKKRLSGFKNAGQMYAPPSTEGTLLSPGWEGGAEWGGPSYDPETGILYVNAIEMPTLLTMLEIKKNR